MVELTKEQAWLITGSLVFLAAVALAMVLKFTQTIMIPFVLAIFVVSIVSPIMDYLILRWKVPHWVGVVAALLVVLAFSAITMLFAFSVLQELLETSKKYWESSITLVERTATNLSVFLDERFDMEVEFNVGMVLKDFNKELVGFSTGTFGKAVNNFTTLVFVMIFVFFLLAGRDPQVILRGVYKEVDVKIRRYLRVKIFVSALTGLLVWLELWMVGMELAPLFGLIVFFLNFIPSIGSIIATFIPIPLALVQFDSNLTVLYVFLVPGVTQFLIGNVLDPKMLGEGLELHPIAVLLSLAFWGVIWGVVGMLLAAPMTAILRIVLVQSETLKPMGQLLAGELPELDIGIPSLRREKKK